MSVKKHHNGRVLDECKPDCIFLLLAAKSYIFNDLIQSDEVACVSHMPINFWYVFARFCIRKKF